MDTLDEVTGFMHSLRAQALPADVVARARWVLLDSLGVMFAGAAEARVGEMARLLRRRGSNGHSMLVADGQPGDAADAALVNSVAACAHVLDEGHKYARGHVATYVLPAVLAAAEESNASGAEFIATLVASYEIAARMGMACRVRESMHPSGTWGTIGAAAGVARLMSFDRPRIRETMNVAAPLTLATSWNAAVEGATVRDLYSGYGGANAVWAARWVGAGFTGCTDDISQVFGRVVSEHFDTATLAGELGSRWEILRNYFKVHSCCRNFQSGIDAAVELTRGHAFEASDIERVEAFTFAIPARDNAAVDSRNVLAARESFPVSLALTLAHGRCDPSVFTEARVNDPALQRLASRVVVACDPELDALYPEKRPSRIVLHLRDGRRLESYAEVALGDPDRPIPPADLERKFRGAANARLGAAAAERVWSLAHEVGSLPSIRELTRQLQPGPAAGRAAAYA